MHIACCYPWQNYTGSTKLKAGLNVANLLPRRPHRHPTGEHGEYEKNHWFPVPTTKLHNKAP